MPETDINKKNLDKLLRRVSSLAEDFFREAGTPDQQQAIVKSLSSAYLNFGQESKVITGQGCPDGWKDCPNGCVAPGDSCDGIG